VFELAAIVGPPMFVIPIPSLGPDPRIRPVRVARYGLGKGA
jgi:hypothetical protein